MAPPSNGGGISIPTTDAPMSQDICVLPESGENYVSQGGALSSDGLTCTLASAAIFNPALYAAFHDES